MFLLVLQIGYRCYKMVVDFCIFTLLLALILRALQFILLGFLVIESISDNDTLRLLFHNYTFCFGFLAGCTTVLALWNIIKF